MLYKVCHVPGLDPKTGEILIHRVTPGETAELIKTAKALNPKLVQYLAKLKPDRNKVYVLIIALGAGEYYGSNINGDFFSEAALAHEGGGYGYKTFLNGHVFRHHQNKDAKTSFGTIPFTTWNSVMRRVELVLAIDKKLAKKFDAQDIVDKIEAGIPLSVSMGCKINYDVCSICHNRARVREEYCTHLQNEMNNIYPDGRKVYADNPFPRFFDLSFVFIGADRIAKTLCKIASGGCCALCDVVAGRQKTAATKVSKQRKLSEILKDVPSSFVRRSVPALEAQEPDISKEMLNEMGSKHQLSSALGTPSFMGMVLKPHEFQRIVLVRLGQSNLADELDEKGEVFRQVEETDDSVPLTFDEGLCGDLLPNLKERSAFGPILKIRMTQLTVRAPKTASARYFSNRVFLEKIAQAYNGYRLRLLSDMPNDLTDVLEQSPRLTTELFHDNFVEAFGKEASIKENVRTIKPLLGIFPVLYYLSAHWQDQERHGKRLSFIQKFVAEHPGLSSFLLAGAVAQVRRGAKVPLVQETSSV